MAVDSTKKWADGPFKLGHLVPDDNGPGRRQFSDACNQMVATHLMITRWLNSIYLQATNVPPKEQKNFIQYMKNWSLMLRHHHGTEETDVFPAIEKICQIPGAMQHNVEQHHVFEEPVQAFYDYTLLLEKDPSKYDGTEVIRKIDAFVEPLMVHLDDEVDTLKVLPDKLPSGVHPESIAYAEFVAEAGKKAGKDTTLDVLYCFLVNNDRTFDNGRMEDFPPVPGPILAIMTYVMPWFKSGIGKFGCCDVFGKPQDMPYAPKKG